MEYLFVIPLTPLKLRNEMREELWKLTKASLKKQKYRNWKVLVLGSTLDNDEDERFIFIDADDHTKVAKIKKALEYIDKELTVKPSYLIRLDDDDIISDSYLQDISSLPIRYDAYSDAHHVCIDPLYLKMSFVRKNWFPNTAIHKYEHAITDITIGKLTEKLFVHDHDACWQVYYENKNVFYSERNSPLYYRILTPFSITSFNAGSGPDTIEWDKYKSYLTSYGPWIKLNSDFLYAQELSEIKQRFFKDPPAYRIGYWLYNVLKHYFNIITARVIIAAAHLPIEYKKSAYSGGSCKRCVLSNSDSIQLYFDTDGICNYCKQYEVDQKELGDEIKRRSYIENKIQEIKISGKGKPYDCILGISGGVDSTYLAYWAKQNNLRPLVVHFDNGWNSEIAVKNIERITSVLNFQLNTYVIDWNEFKEMQKAFLKAGVIDIEMLTDHAIMATIYKFARQYNIKYTLNGYNLATEGIMPREWVHKKEDFRNIKDICWQFGRIKIRSFPHLTFLRKLWYGLFLKLESVKALNYIEYNKEKAKEIIKTELGWQDYGGKHYESVFTKFYQAYILPEKFKVDKRKAHLATLINSGQLTKEKALQQLKEPLYKTAGEKEDEKNYILKKLDFKEEEFDAIMKAVVKKHSDFRTEQEYWNTYFKVIKWLRPWKQ